ncbi:hypothetical protein [Legionella gresilensis]|uniref:hypothetical protein n=1 Tax=Legionella gresilensis TaxID=91823 RepID=UPI0010412A43|nr:hypothetical protein [Legionella gresilensis]
MDFYKYLLSAVQKDTYKDLAESLYSFVRRVNEGVTNPRGNMTLIRQLSINLPKLKAGMNSNIPDLLLEDIKGGGRQISNFIHDENIIGNLQELLQAARDDYINQQNLPLSLKTETTRKRKFSILEQTKEGAEIAAKINLVYNLTQLRKTITNSLLALNQAPLHKLTEIQPQIIEQLQVILKKMQEIENLIALEKPHSNVDSHIRLSVADYDTILKFLEINLLDNNYSNKIYNYILSKSISLIVLIQDPSREDHIKAAQLMILAANRAYSQNKDISNDNISFFLNHLRIILGKLTRAQIDPIPKELNTSIKRLINRVIRDVYNFHRCDPMICKQIIALANQFETQTKQDSQFDLKDIYNKLYEHALQEGRKKYDAADCQEATFLYQEAIDYFYKSLDYDDYPNARIFQLQPKQLQEGIPPEIKELPFAWPSMNFKHLCHRFITCHEALIKNYLKQAKTSEPQDRINIYKKALDIITYINQLIDIINDRTMNLGLGKIQILASDILEKINNLNAAHRPTTSSTRLIYGVFSKQNAEINNTAIFQRFQNLSKEMPHDILFELFKKIYYKLYSASITKMKKLIENSSISSVQGLLDYLNKNKDKKHSKTIEVIKEILESLDEEYAAQVQKKLT